MRRIERGERPTGGLDRLGRELQPVTAYLPKFQNSQKLIGRLSRDVYDLDTLGMNRNRPQDILLR
jgi:hypothetical protein